MLTPQQVIDSEYLESRCALIEIAAMLDRYDIATQRHEVVAERTEKLECLREAFVLLADAKSSSNRAERLLQLFATV